MDDEVTPLGELELWERPSPGHVAPWVQAVLVLATILGVVAVGVAGWALWRIGGGHRDTDRVGFILLPMFLMATAVAITAYPDGRLSRFVRLAVALPVIHAIALIVALLYIPRLDMPALGDRTPLMEALPAEACFALALAGFAVVARLLGGKGEGWAHAFVMLALAYLVLLGLWLPIMAQLPVRDDGFGFHAAPTLAMLEQRPLDVALLAAVPPLVVAVLYTRLALSRAARRARNPLALALGGLFVASMVCRVRANRGAFLVHDNLLHLLLVAVMLAIVATSILAITTWRSGRRTLRSLGSAGAREATIVDGDTQIVACLQITSWLRGPRLWMRACVVSSAGELLPIPSGATLATALPPISSAMRTGEAVAILHQREPITLAGFVDREVGEAPFRAVRLAVPGPEGITIGRREPMSTPVESMLLTAWRPAVAYLLIVLVVAAPTLVGLFVDGGR